MKIKLLLIYILFLSISFSQTTTKSKIKPLDPKRYDAWSIEYPEYKGWFETFLNQYKSLHPEDSLIVDIKQNDQIIIVESLQESNQSKRIYEIWYGIDSDYTIIPGEKVSWILGSEFKKILLEKKYFHLDSKVVFFDSEQGRLSNTYQSVNDIWTNRSLIISTERILSKLPTKPDYGLVITLSNPLLGYPKGISKSIGLGVSLKLVEMGLQIPFTGYKFPLYNINSSSIITNIGEEIYGNTWGGYGKFSINELQGNFEVHTRPIRKSDINISESSGDSVLVGLVKGMVTKEINIFKSNYSSLRPKISLFPGVYFQRYMHYNLEPEDDNILTGDAYIISNLYLRLEYISIIKNKFPIIESFYQLMLDHSSILSITFNVTKNIGIRVDSIHYFESDVTSGLPTDMLSAGLRLKFDY